MKTVVFFLYKTKISSKLDLNAGLTYHPTATLTSENTRKIATVLYNINGIELIGEENDIPVDNTKMKIPAVFTFGLGVGESKKWAIGSEVTFSNNSEMTNRFGSIENVSFENSKKVICFNGTTKELVGKRLKEIHHLPNFEQFIEVLSLFQMLATSNEKMFLHELPFDDFYNNKEQNRLKIVYAFIENNFQRNITIDEMGQLTHLSKAAFCRYFKKMTRLTFIEFLNQYRI